MKKVISLNNDWIFCKEGVKENVNLPHRSGAAGSEYHDSLP